MGIKHTFTLFAANNDSFCAAGKKALYPAPEAFVGALMIEADYILEDWFADDPPEIANAKTRAELLSRVKDRYVRGCVQPGDDGPEFCWAIEYKPGRGHVPAWVIED